MANPYHDGLGKFCSRNEMRAAYLLLQKNGDANGYLKLRKEYEALDKSNAFTPEALTEKLDSMSAKPLSYPHANETPVEVDQQLAEIYGEYYRKISEIDRVDGMMKNYEKRLDPKDRFYRDNEYYKKQNKEGFDRQQAAKVILEAEAAAILDKAVPFEDEYIRRGRWTRAFLVENTNGHVHSSTSCSTTYSTTRHAWLPQYSGSDESKIVDDAGEAACTVCYPSAPIDVLKRKTRIELPERKAARIEKEAAAAIKAQKDAVKSIFTPDGKPLKLEDTYNSVIKSARTAEIEATSLYSEKKAVEAGRYNGYNNNPDRNAMKQRNFDTLISALAHKYGRTEQEQLALIAEKGEKKFKKEWS